MTRQWVARLPTEILWRAAKIALFVGSILNLINQGDALWGSAELSLPHVLLNYLVPFAVSAFSAVQARGKTPS